MKHVPVLLNETIAGLDIKDNDVIVDATLGSGGHTKEICSLGKKNLTIVGVDADEDAIDRAKETLKDCNSKIIFSCKYNHHLNQILKDNEITLVDKFLFDLGMSSPQIDDSGRGFSFMRNEPLLMTMKKDPDESDLTAKEIVNTWEEESLADIFYGYGEERYSRRIAKAIVEYRKDEDISTTFDLVNIIRKATPATYGRKKIHPATRVFQALRTVVNNEIENHKVALRQAWNNLAEGGRIAVITFHSLEDRVVKRMFKELEAEGGKRITKKPIVPSDEEVEQNPRARSAKLRILEKVNNN